MAVSIKSEREIELMRQSNHLLAGVFQELKKIVEP
jgi:methionine aminopeptidase